MESINPGSILINTTNNKLYGVLVSKLPNNKLIVFRLDKNTHPIFSKFDYHDHIAKVGIINEYQYANLKSALLKHYRTYKLTETEKKMLKPLMDFAFPIGIPEYEPGRDLTDTEIISLDLHSKFIPGSRLIINTPPKSCYNSLDGKTMTVVEKGDNGVWLYLPSGESDMSKLGNSLYYIFYRNKELPTFSGISRITPIIEHSETLPQLDETIMEAFKSLKDNAELVSTMEFEGEKVKILPNNMKVIFPEVFQNMTYNPKTDSFFVEPGFITTAMSKRLGDKLMVGGQDTKGQIIEMNSFDNELVFNGDNGPRSETELSGEVKMNEDGELVFVGGGKREESLTDKELQAIADDEVMYSKYEGSRGSGLDRNIDDIGDINVFEDENEEISNRSRKLFLTDDDEEGEYEVLMSSLNSKSSQYETESETGTIRETDTEGETDAETDYDESEFAEIIAEDDTTDLGIFEKVKRVEVSELEKVYKESIQIGDLYKYKLEKIPYLLRNNPNVINQIYKDINIISLLKHKVSEDDGKGIHFAPQDYKPLVSKYIKGDYTNKFLIPLVINRKKIYLDKSNKSQGQKDEYDTQSHEVIEDYYNNLQNLIGLQDKKNNSVNNDNYVNNIISEMAPYTISESSDMGLLFRLGSELDKTDYHKLSQDTLTIKYCDKPMKCQSYTLSPMNFDYQVNLGPMARFVDAEDVEDDLLNGEDEEDEKIEDSIIYNRPYFKPYYEGDLINIIGYVRPPLDYFNKPTTKLLEDMYKDQKEKKEVVTINLEDIDPEIVDEDLEEQYSITQNPNKFVLFLLPQGEFTWREMENEFSKIIPSIDELIKLYLDKVSDNTIEHIYEVLEKFNYDTRELSTDIQDKILEKHEKLIEKYQSFNQKTSEKYKVHLEKVNEEMKRKEKEKKNKVTNAAKDKENKERFKYINNDILEEIGKFYYNVYENKDKPIDSDDTRLAWFNKQFDNGTYFYKTIFANYLKMYHESRKLENLETELAILKEKYALAQTTSQTMGTTAGSNAANAECEKKTTGPNVIKYPSLARLERDNGKVAVDSDGNVIMSGDYALVDVENTKQLYKREIVGNVDMWIRDDISALYKLINDKKNKCISNPEIKLDKADMCIFDPEELKCEAGDYMIQTTKQMIDMELLVNDLQKEIDYIKHIPRLLSALNKEIVKDRIALVNKLNSVKRFWRQKEDEEKALDEKIKNTIMTLKPCVHFDVTDYFFKIKGFGEDRYKFAQSILKNFQNNEDAFVNDYATFNRNDNNKNFCYCNICNQELLCNHFRLGISYLQEDNPVNFDLIISSFGTEKDGAYFCKACNEPIATTAIIDMDDFASGENGGVIRTRELAESTPLIDKQKDYINKMIDKALEAEQGNEDFQERLKVYELLKLLSNLEVLSIKDEVDMMNFLKSYNFQNRNKILTQLITKFGTGNLPLIKKTGEQYYIRYMVADIAARFLITLQTTITPYEIKNRGCDTNIMGYPIINDMSEADGINYIMCLFNQMKEIPEYVALGDMKSSLFTEQLRKQVEEDSYVKDKLFSALNVKFNNIDYMEQFETYYTNNWKTYMPRMAHIDLHWEPEKILNSANLKEVNAKVLPRMLEVGHEDCTYFALKFMDAINRVVENSEQSNIKGLANYCCPHEFNPNKKLLYLDYFREYSGDINKYLKEFEQVADIITQLELKRRYPINSVMYGPVYKPSQAILPLTFNVNKDEIKSVYLKFIDKGLNKGKLHIYDKYGRCVLSNEKKEDIMMKEYSAHDYNRIEEARNSGNQIDVKKYFEDDAVNVDMKVLELHRLEDLIQKCPDMKIMKYIKNYLEKMRESADEVFETKQPQQTKTTKKGEAKFDINRHLSQLNSQIENEIVSLVRKITTTEKNIDKYSKIMSNLGDFKALYNEFKESHTEEESELFRYNKKEEHIKYTMKYLNDVINQIKNNRLSNPLDKESIRPQFRDFLNYGEHIKLFKLISGSNKQLYDFAKMIKSKHNFKLLFPEMVASLLQYLNIISLVNMFDVLDTNKVSRQKVEEVKYKFRVPEEPDEALKDLAREMEIELQDDENYGEGDKVDFIESFEIKNSDNLKAIGGFILTYLDKVNDIQTTYDELTFEYINLVNTENEQKRIENTLKSFEWLAKEGHEAERQVIFLKMNKLKKISYADLTSHLISEYGDDIFNETETYESTIAQEEFDENGERIMRRNEMGLDSYEQGEIGEVFDEEDMDDVDQDYGMLAVGGYED